MGLTNNKSSAERTDTTFATILADGKIHVAVPEDTEGAVKRLYATEKDREKGPDVKTGEKWEHIYTEVSGLITKIDFHEGNYGINLLIEVGDKDDEKPVTLAIGTASNYGEDLMKKLPNIDLKKPVTIAPFSFTNDKGKKARGVTVTQKDKKGKPVKVLSFFYDTDKKAVSNGYPKPPSGKKIQKSAWRKYFDEAREFLIEDTIERFEIKESRAEGESDEDYEARKKALKTF